MAGSLIDLSGSGAKAGTLAIVSAQAALLDGVLRGDGGGSFTLDTGSIPSFAALADKLAASGFNGDLSVRLRAGDLTIDGTTRASSFALAADAGSIVVTGTIDVSGAKGGTIALSAKQDLTVAAGARLSANAGDAGERSGLIELSSTDGIMDLRAGARIEALGGRNGNGDIKLRFRRDDGAGTVNLVSAAATMTAARIVAEAYRDYTTTSVDASLPAALADAATFMANRAAAIEASLGRAGDPTFHLVPGIELTSTGDLTLSSAVDLHAARYNGEAGVLTLRAAGNLLLDASLSDGFASAAATAAVLTDTASWSYRLAGGADLAAANPLAVRPLAAFAGATSGSVKLASGAIVRTGTGAIDVAAGNDVTLADQTAVIYTAGARIADASLGGTYTGNIANPAFTSGGGDIRISAQNDVRTLVPGGQMIVDWQWRAGRFQLDSNNFFTDVFVAGKQTAWWINFARFQQGIAALGGGSVSVTAGRDVAETSVITVTQGRVGGGRTAGEAKTVAITGGGDLTVAAGRNILGGVYYVDGGTGVIAAGGNITAGHTISYVRHNSSGETLVRGVNPQLAIGDAVLTVSAGGAIELAGAGNPTQWYRSRDNAVAFGEDFGNRFRPGRATSARRRNEPPCPSSRRAATSRCGTIPRPPTTPRRRHGLESIRTNLFNYATDPFIYYPGKTKVVAASGDINIVNGMLVLPSATGNLDLWAQGSLYLKLISKESFSRVLAVGSMDARAFRYPRRPEPYSDRELVRRPRFWQPDRTHLDPARGRPRAEPVLRRGRRHRCGRPSQQGQHRALHLCRRAGPVPCRPRHRQSEPARPEQPGERSHAGHRRPRRQSGPRRHLHRRSGLRAGRGRSRRLPRQGRRHRDRRQWRDRGQQSDLSQHRTAKGRRGPAGAGRHGGRPAIRRVYRRLSRPDQCRGHAVLPRVGRSADLSRSARRLHAAGHRQYLLSDGGPRRIRDPRFADHRKFLINAVLSRELRAAGRGKVDGLEAGLGYERGYAAIATLYPGAERKGNTAWQGDIIMDVSKIRTYLGGNLDIAAPGGNLQVSALSSTATGPTNGVLTINGGEIRIFTGLDTIINTSRILTARGGDVTIWSSYGDIDAGKGKKSALTNPPVTYALSNDGSISYTVNPSFTGSGISTQKGAPDAPISSVDLYAPDGIINAGDAGIRSSGAIYLGALEIRGADNIQAGGEIKGVPKQAASVASLAVETKDKAAADAAKDAGQSGAREQPSVIIVEVLGYGGGDTGTPSEEEERRRRRQDLESESKSGQLRPQQHIPRRWQRRPDGRAEAEADP